MTATLLLFQYMNNAHKIQLLYKSQDKLKYFERIEIKSFQMLENGNVCNNNSNSHQKLIIIQFRFLFLESSSDAFSYIANCNYKLY